MARIRTIKPAFWESEQIGRLSPLARLLFLALISNADDEGRLRGNPAHLRAIAFRYDDLTIAQVADLLAELETQALVTVYVVEGAAYVQIDSWAKHQRVDHARPSDLPPPPPREPLANPREALANPREALANPREALAPDKEGEEEKDDVARAHARDAAIIAIPRAATPVVADVDRIVEPLGRRLSPHQHARAVRIATEHGPDVLEHLVAQARGPGITKPIAALARFLTPESDALLDAIAACTAERDRRAALAADVERVIRLKQANGIPV